VEVPIAFMQGLVEARTARARGGDDASLRPLRTLIASIERRAAPGTPQEIAALLLRAAAAAAQNEHGELLAYLSQALQVERARGARGLSGAPILSADELAGEFWLDVHRYDDAVAAFRTARGAVGDTPRLTAGLARALARQRLTTDACSEYRRLAAHPGARRPSMAGELAEAERVLAQPDCRAVPIR
jgi:cytochrome c-type biogenesis protein CcmH/NrfG